MLGAFKNKPQNIPAAYNFTALGKSQNTIRLAISVPPLKYFAWYYYIQ